MMRMPHSSGQKSWELLMVSALVFIAIITRLYNFWEWPFVGDEYYTVEHSLMGLFNPARPAYYVLTALMFKIFGVSEWSARLPAIGFAIISIPVFFYLAKRFLGTGTALYGALFIIFSEWHLYYSQFSRYYSAVFLFAVLSYFIYYEAIRTGKLKLLFYALFCNGLGILFHATSVVVPISCALFSALVLILKYDEFGPDTKRIAKIHLVIIVTSGLLILPFLLRVLAGWEGLGQTWGYGPLKQFLQLVKYIGVPVFIAAAFGILLLLREDRTRGLFLLITMVLPVVFLIGLSVVTTVRPDYVFYALPLFLLSAAYLCDESRKSLANKKLVAHAISIILIFTMLPEFVSYYTSKQSLDVRDAIKFVERDFQVGDKVLPLVDGFEYYSNMELEKLPRSAYVESIDWPTELQPYAKSKDRLWVIVPLRRKEISAKLRKWLSENTSLIWQKQSNRYDYTVDGYQIYLKR